jgi:virginiamycin B lyase
LGADGNIWFSTNDVLPDAGLDPAGSLIGSITRAGAITFYPRPTSGSLFEPFQLAAAPDGTIWYSNFFGNFGRILSPSAGAACDAGRYGETFAVAGSVGSNGIALDSQGNPWLFAATNFNGFPARFSPPAPCTTYADASDGFDIFAPASVSATKLVRGPDGAMWFGESSKVARIAPDGTIAEYPLGETNSGDVTVGPDNFLWFEWTGGVGKFDPATKVATPYVNAATEFDYPIAAGPDGNIWFAGHLASGYQLGRMKTDGTTLPAYPIPGFTADLAVGGDGNMWFTDGASYAIGYVVP